MLGVVALTNESRASTSHFGLKIDVMTNEDSHKSTKRAGEAVLVPDDEAVPRPEHIVFVRCGYPMCSLVAVCLSMSI